MRRFWSLSLVLFMVSLGFSCGVQRVEAQGFSAFRVPAPMGLPICPFHVLKLDELGIPFQFGMPCGMASIASSPEPQSPEPQDIAPVDCFEESLTQTVAHRSSPAPAMPVTQFEDLTPAVDMVFAENLTREAVGRVRRMLLMLTPQRWVAIINSHVELVADLAQAGFSPEFCYGPWQRPAVAEEAFTDRSVANHSMTIHVVPEEEVVEPVREILPITLHFTPFDLAPLATGCLSRLVSDPRVMLSRDEALARDYVLDEGEYFAEDGYYDGPYGTSDCIWTGINTGMCGKTDGKYGSDYDTQQWTTTASIQAIVASKQSCATDTTWVGCDEAAALIREQAYRSLERASERDAASAASTAVFADVAAGILKRLGAAMEELAERIEQIEVQADSATPSENDGIRQRASFDAADGNMANAAQLYLGL